jgi:uncharacterized protein YyaL (SSP411 family)
MKQIQWTQWGPEAFARAQREDRPILLSISAVWCHWCHVMDDTTYSNELVIDAINENYVPIRVDNDERPDINARYNMGGWPTTAFLTPEGMTLTGATYLPPEQMQRALGDMLRFYTSQKSDIEKRAAEIRSARIDYGVTPIANINPEMIDKLTAGIVANYDEEYGGFGDAPKFPQPELLDFLFAEWRAVDDPHLYEVVARTLAEMANGGMYDHVEGGFFRYSTTRDWSVPHFEKMSEDHAGLIRVLAQLQIAVPTNHTRETLGSALEYLRTVLRDPQTHLFAGSQDADEEYFALPMPERCTRQAPFVDHRSYTNWTSALAGAFAWASLALQDAVLSAEALATLDAIHNRLHDESGLLYHVVSPGEPPRISGLLGDQVSYVRALLDTYEITGEPRMLDRAIAHADRVLARFCAVDGGFYDSVHDEKIGRLEISDRPIGENGIFAECLLRLHVITANEAYQEAAEGVLTLYARTFERAGSFAATYARALRRYFTKAVSVRIQGSLEATADLREASRRLPGAFVTVHGEVGPTPAAYVCVGTTCAAPVASATELRHAYDALRQAQVDEV